MTATLTAPSFTAPSFAALADPTRQRILELLAATPLAMGDIARHFPLSGPAISQHLKILKGARLVRSRAQAQKRIYELDPAGIDEMAAWVEGIRAFWNPRLDALESAIRNES